VALAPLDFGQFSHDLLIAQFAGGGSTQFSGVIAAYDLVTAVLKGCWKMPPGARWPSTASGHQSWKRQPRQFGLGRRALRRGVLYGAGPSNGARGLLRLPDRGFHRFDVRATTSNWRPGELLFRPGGRLSSAPGHPHHAAGLKAALAPEWLGFPAGLGGSLSTLPAAAGNSSSNWLDRHRPAEENPWYAMQPRLARS